jgi:hypothetical protein
MKSVCRVLAVPVVLVLILPPIFSDADWNNNGGNGNGDGSNRNGHSTNSRSNSGNWHDRGQYNRYDHGFTGVNFSVWPGNYYYNAPYYPPSDGVYVSEPVYVPLVVNGTTYYINNGIYYVYNGYEYQEVPPPTIAQQPQAVNGPAAPEGSITIYIPDKKGGYTPVTLKRSGAGFIGPQGEYYPKFPKVSQLEAIYGR